MFSSMFLMDPNTVLIMMIWCKSRDFSKKVWSWSVRSIDNLKRNGKKQFKKKMLTTFFVYGEKVQLKGMDLIGGFTGS